MKFATPEEALQNIKANEDEIKDLLFEMLVAWQTHEIAGNTGDFSEFISDEPTRLFRRQFILSHATLAGSSSWR